MNALSKDVIPVQSVTERASHALSKEDTEAEIKALVAQSRPIVAVTDGASREVCHSSLMTLRNLRVQIEKRGKEGREEATRYSKAVIAIEKELIGLLTPEETRLAKLRDEFDAEKERKRQAEIEAEMERQKTRRESVARLQNFCIALTPSSGSTNIMGWILDLESLVIDDDYQEFREQAESAKTASLTRLRSLYDAALAHEEAQRKLEADRAELERLKTVEVERQRIATEEQAKQKAVDKAARDAERKRLDEEKAENERMARERQAELDRQEAEAKATRDAEAARLATERAEIERERQALNDAQKVNEVASRQESAPPAPLQAVPDLKEIPQDQGTSPVEDADDKPLDGLVLAVLLSRARYYVAHYPSEDPEEEEDRCDLIDEIDEVLPPPPTKPTSTVIDGKPEEWDEDIAF